MGVPVWITDPRGTVCFINARAEALLGVSATEAVGRPCHEIVRGLEPAGLPHCVANCPLMRRARGDRELEPFTIVVPRPDGGKRALELIAIPDRRVPGGEPWLVHCARDITGEARSREYLARLASRSASGGATARLSPDLPLTRRQSEILALLARDETLRGVSLRLGVSHATVRNHVQHILARLGAHSISEAVARFLLGRS